MGLISCLFELGALGGVTGLLDIPPIGIDTFGPAPDACSDLFVGGTGLAAEVIGAGGPGCGRGPGRVGVGLVSCLLPIGAVGGVTCLLTGLLFGRALNP